MIRLVSVIFLVIFVSVISSQTHLASNEKPDFKFEHFSIEQGLSQSNVRCILQDRQGFLWLGTQDGLNRFDGYEFLVFKNKIGNNKFSIKFVVYQQFNLGLMIIQASVIKMLNYA